jgi:P4 family phage/plasmid primase-like protien
MSTLGRELEARQRQDGIIKSTFYICPGCETVTESHDNIDKCQNCAWEGEFHKAKNKEKIESIIAMMHHPHYSKFLCKIVTPKEDEAEMRENRLVELSRLLAERKGFLASARMFLEEQPIYYDENRIWWVWQHREFCWKITDETTVINLITQINRIIGDSGVKYKNLLVEAIRQEARKAKPATPPNNIIQFKQQFYNIDTREFSPATPKYFCVNPIPWDVGESSDTPVMDKLFTDWVGDKWKQTLYELLAYCCYAEYPIQLIFCLSGGGRNGKSQFQRLLTNFIGITNICSTELDAITNPNRTFERFTLYKKLCCLMGETNYDSIKDTALLKKLTGDDMINFQKKYADPFDAYNYAKIIINTNGLPDSNDKSDGYYRRWLIIDFPNQFAEGKPIINTIPQIEYEALARKVCDILPELIKHGHIANEGSIQERKARYETRANPLMDFLTKYCVFSDAYKIKYSTIYTKYTHWLNGEKKRLVNRKEFTEILTRNGYEIEKKNIKNDEGQYESGLWVFGFKMKEQLCDFESYSPHGNDVLDVNAVLPLVVPVYKRVNSEHDAHIVPPARLNGVTSVSSGNEYTFPYTGEDFISKAGVLQEIKHLTKISYGDLERIFPKINELNKWITELKSEGRIFESPAGILNILE